MPNYDKTDAFSIYEFSKGLLNKCLRDFIASEYEDIKGKGGLGEMVEDIYFGYKPNGFPGPDFDEAGVELKCTPLKESSKKELLIKERLVCNMINYCDVVKEDFENSHFYLKCQLMLIMFYLHKHSSSRLDLKFLFSILWLLPEKDLLVIKHDYEVIINKVKNGLAHTISEGDTMYLGACRKGAKGTDTTQQPYSNIPAPTRAFCLKGAYMRIILDYVTRSGKNAITNINRFDLAKHNYQSLCGIPESDDRYNKVQSLFNRQIEIVFPNIDISTLKDYEAVLGRLEGEVTGTKKRKLNELVSLDELLSKSFDEIIIGRFAPFIGKNEQEIKDHFQLQYKSTVKNKFSILANAIASNGANLRVNQSEEFQKSGLNMKTIRVQANGRIKEAMSFENINYQEVYDVDDWIDSRLYELFTSRFLFVVYREQNEGMNDFILDKVFFWTMPQSDLEVAESYWKNIKENVRSNRINPRYFWKISDKNYFHVRPKGQNSTDLAINPNGGKCKKYCYWFNNEYISKIVKDN